MKCEDCGVEMNHHAHKVDYNAALEEPDAVDPALGGAVEEARACPACGRTEVRRAGATPN